MFTVLVFIHAENVSLVSGVKLIESGKIKKTTGNAWKPCFDFLADLEGGSHKHEKNEICPTERNDEMQIQYFDIHWFGWSLLLKSFKTIEKIVCTENQVNSLQAT